MTKRQLRPICAEQAEIERVPYRISVVLDDIQARLFPTLNSSVSCIFTRSDTLASITPPSDMGANAKIRISCLINLPDTPREVIEAIIIHELIHLEINPRLIGEKTISHPPEFWQMESELSPVSGLCMAWIYDFPPILKDR